MLLHLVQQPNYRSVQEAGTSVLLITFAFWLTNDSTPGSKPPLGGHSLTQLCVCHIRVFRFALITYITCQTRIARRPQFPHNKLQGGGWIFCWLCGFLFTWFLGNNDKCKFQYAFGCCGRAPKNNPISINDTCQANRERKPQDPVKIHTYSRSIYNILTIW